MPTSAIFILLLNIAMHGSCIRSHIPNRASAPKPPYFREIFHLRATLSVSFSLAVGKNRVVSRVRRNCLINHAGYRYNYFHLRFCQSEKVKLLRINLEANISRV